jgi:hypothetical protein
MNIIEAVESNNLEFIKKMLVNLTLTKMESMIILYCIEQFIMVI